MKIKMTEEQARDFLKNCYQIYDDVKDSIHINKKICNLKNRGYIKKSDLEIAKEDFYKCIDHLRHCYDIHPDNYRAIVNYSGCLEKEIERLKDGK